MTPPTNPEDEPLSATASRSADEADAVIEAGPGSSVVIELPFGLTAMADEQVPEPKVSPPIQIESGPWKGFAIIVDLDLEIRAQEALLTLQDKKAGVKQQLDATYDFLETVLIAWNLAERVATNDGRVAVRMLPQPRDGGVRRLKSSQLEPLMKAINKAFQPDPN